MCVSFFLLLSSNTKTSCYENQSESSRIETVQEIGQNDLDDFQPISFLIEENFQFIAKQSGASKFGVELKSRCFFLGFAKHQDIDRSKHTQKTQGT